MSRNDPIPDPPEEQPAGADLILALVNEGNETAYVLDDISFGLPEALSGSAIKNTAIVLNPTTTGAFRRSVRVFYNRLDLNVLLTPAAVSIVESGDMSVANSEAILTKFLNDYGFEFLATDIQALPVTDEAYPKTVTFRAAADSMKYTGEYQFMLTDPANVIETEYNAILGYPFADVEGYYNYDGVSIDEDFFKYVTNDAEIIFASRVIDAAEQTSPSVGTGGSVEYTIDSAGADWAIDAACYIRTTGNALSDQRDFINDFDFSLEIEQPGNGLHTLTQSHNAGVFSMDITIGEDDLSFPGWATLLQPRNRFAVVEHRISMHDIRNAFSVESVNAGAVPIGTFYVRLICTRKSNAEVVGSQYYTVYAS